MPEPAYDTVAAGDLPPPTAVRLDRRLPAVSPLVARGREQFQSEAAARRAAYLAKRQEREQSLRAHYRIANLSLARRVQAQRALRAWASVSVSALTTQLRSVSSDWTTAPRVSAPLRVRWADSPAVSSSPPARRTQHGHDYGRQYRRRAQLLIRMTNIFLRHTQLRRRAWFDRWRRLCGLVSSDREQRVLALSRLVHKHREAHVRVSRIRTLSRAWSKWRETCRVQDSVERYIVAAERLMADRDRSRARICRRLIFGSAVPTDSGRANVDETAATPLPSVPRSEAELARLRGALVVCTDEVEQLKQQHEHIVAELSDALEQAYDKHAADMDQMAAMLDEREAVIAQLRQQLASVAKSSPPSTVGTKVDDGGSKGVAGPSGAGLECDSGAESRRHRTADSDTERNPRVKPPPIPSPHPARADEGVADRRSSPDVSPATNERAAGIVQSDRAPIDGEAGSPRSHVVVSHAVVDSPSARVVDSPNSVAETRAADQGSVSAASLSMTPVAQETLQARPGAQSGAPPAGARGLSTAEAGPHDHRQPTALALVPLAASGSDGVRSGEATDGSVAGRVPVGGDHTRDRSPPASVYDHGVVEYHQNQGQSTRASVSPPLPAGVSATADARPTTPSQSAAEAPVEGRQPASAPTSSLPVTVVVPQPRSAEAARLGDALAEPSGRVSSNVFGTATDMATAASRGGAGFSEHGEASGELGASGERDSRDAAPGSGDGSDIADEPPEQPSPHVRGSAPAESASAASPDAAASASPDAAASDTGIPARDTTASVSPPVEDPLERRSRRMRVLREVFARLDRNGDGEVSRAEVIKSARSDADMAALLGLPPRIRQEDGTRAMFEQVFQRLDTDSSKSIEWGEFVDYFIDRGDTDLHAAAIAERGPRTVAEGAVGGAAGGAADGTAGCPIATGGAGAEASRSVPPTAEPAAAAPPAAEGSTGSSPPRAETAPQSITLASLPAHDVPAAEQLFEDAQSSGSGSVESNVEFGDDDMRALGDYGV